MHRSPPPRNAHAKASTLLIVLATSWLGTGGIACGGKTGGPSLGDTGPEGNGASAGSTAATAGTSSGAGTTSGAAANGGADVPPVGAGGAAAGTGGSTANPAGGTGGTVDPGTSGAGGMAAGGTGTTGGSGAGGASAGGPGTGGAAGTSSAGGSSSMSCVGVSEADLQPIPSCEEAPAASLAAALCAPTLCTFKGESCRQIYTSCATHEGCSRAIACSLLCKAGEDSVTNCAKFAGSGITSALKVRSCQQELQSQEANNPPSMCAK